MGLVYNFLRNESDGPQRREMKAVGTRKLAGLIRFNVLGAQSVDEPADCAAPSAPSPRTTCLKASRALPCLPPHQASCRPPSSTSIAARRHEGRRLTPLAAH